MTTKSQIQHSLAQVDDCVLVVIDIQDYFLKKYSTEVSSAVLEKSVWLIKLAKALKVPVVAMAEDINNVGNLSKAVLEVLPANLQVHNKNTFGLGGHSDILQDIEKTGRTTAVIIGMETDVCVAHSALHLINQGYEVVVVKDAVATTSEFDSDVGLNRMRHAGAAISSTKAIYYEWLASVKALEALLEQKSQIYNLAPIKL